MSNPTAAEMLRERWSFTVSTSGPGGVTLMLNKPTGDALIALCEALEPKEGRYDGDSWVACKVCGRISDGDLGVMHAKNCTYAALVAALRGEKR